MKNPELSIIIPTYNRPKLLHRAINSALAQTLPDVEVIVVDDASPEPVRLPEQPNLRVIRLSENRGHALARNVGAQAARGRLLSYLDDDDILLPEMAEVSLKSLENTDLPQPVALISALEVVNSDGKVIKKRIPPTLPKGSHYFLEKIPAGQSFLTKQTLVIERDLLLDIGGFDESFKSRVHTEFFLRLNPVCSLLGIPVVTYRLYRHQDTRLSTTHTLRQESFKRLLDKHKTVFEKHPKTFAKFVYEHACRSYESGQLGAAMYFMLWAMRLDPLKTWSRFQKKTIDKRFNRLIGKQQMSRVKTKTTNSDAT